MKNKRELKVNHKEAIIEINMDKRFTVVSQIVPHTKLKIKSSAAPLTKTIIYN